ncbi:MAG: hypothetical protein ACRER0_06250 [Gammaproteobacteria bacterium]
MANKFGLVDVPGERKIHRVSVPLVGGLAIWMVQKEIDQNKA